MQTFDGILPAAWSHGNPVDILGDASPQRYAETLATAARNPNSDGLMVILTPQAMTALMIYPTPSCLLQCMIPRRRYGTESQTLTTGSKFWMSSRDPPPPLPYWL